MTRRVFLTCVLLAMAVFSFAQEKSDQPKASFMGDWIGVLEVPQQGQLKMNVQVEKSDKIDGSYTATMNIPQQNFYGGKFDEVKVDEEARTINFASYMLGLTLQCKMPTGTTDAFNCQMTQSGLTFPMDFTRVVKEEKAEKSKASKESKKGKKSKKKKRSKKSKRKKR